MDAAEDTPRPSGAREDPDHPGWWSWEDIPADSFAAATGKLLFRPDGPGRGIVRMFPTEKHLNLGGSLHGGAVMSFIDMALFGGGRCAGMSRAHYVTLDLTTKFLSRGRAGVPLDAHVELIRQTRSLAFLQGVVKQDGEACYSFTGTLKKLRESS
ncbi:PaaI family thioesterase [Sphingomonas arenae]|uniref:PaaI family thioesterase n=1 Tax=Sphingomonas arenae TaxID=2812555 RepID=UPI0019670BC7|nr:PaaI family thioesterase [Sphingomonas arenae]